VIEGYADFLAACTLSSQSGCWLFIAQVQSAVLV
jgi:hypothetical protein